MGFCFPYGCRWTLVPSAQHHGGYSLRLHIDSSERGPVNNRLSSTSTWTIPDQVDLVRPLRRKGSPSYSILDDLNPPAFDRRNRAQVGATRRQLPHGCCCITSKSSVRTSEHLLRHIVFIDYVLDCGVKRVSRPGVTVSSRGRM